MHHASRSKSILELGILRIVGQFRLFFRIQVIQIAEKLVESMHGRQEFIAISEVVLAKLAGSVAERLEQFSDSRVFALQSHCGAWHSNLRQARAQWVLTSNEGCASSGATLLSIKVGEGDAFGGDAVDVRRPVAHHAPAEVADVPSADVIAP